MAYIANPDVKKDPNDVTQTGPTILTGAPSGDGGGNPLMGGNASNAAYAQPNSAPTSSGSFTNLQQYLDTNQPQATQLGQKLGSDLTQKATDATGAIDTAATSFRNQVDQNTVKLDPTLEQKAIADPTNFVNSADFDKLSKILSGTYSGPASLDKVTDLYQPVVDKVSAANTAATLGGTSGGRMELLRNLPGSTPYARGGLSLDQMLVQNTDPARQAVEAGVESIKPVDSKLSTTQADLSKTAADAATASQAAAATTKQHMVDAQGAFRDQLTARVAQQQQVEAARQAAIKAALDAAVNPNDAAVLAANHQAAIDQANLEAAAARQKGQFGLSGAVIQAAAQAGAAQNQPIPMPVNPNPTAGQLSPEQLAAMGITQDQFNSLLDQQRQAQTLGGKGVNLSDYLHTVDPSTISVSNVASTDDAARYAALQKLSGLSDGFLTGVSGPLNMLNFDTTSALGALNGQIEAGKTREAANQAAVQANIANGEYAKQMSNAADRQATMSGAAAGASIGAAVSDGVGAAIGAVAGAIFCFVKGTPMLMADGSLKNVEAIDIGDEMMLGGRVLATGKAVEQTIYSYHGVFVAGNHTIFGEDGVWRKVADCTDATPVEIENDGAVIVCPIVNENHLMVTSDFISADFAEVDNIGWDMNGKDRLEYLNNWTERNEKLLNVLKATFPHKYEDEDKTISAE